MTFIGRCTPSPWALPGPNWRLNVSSYRWLLEEDATFHIDPQVQPRCSGTLNFHGSYIPVVAKETSADLSLLTNADPTKHYLSILPDNAGTDAAIPSAAHRSRRARRRRA
jgi:hypothetical protein